MTDGVAVWSGAGFHPRTLPVGLLYPDLVADTVELTDRARALFDQVRAGRGPLTMVLGSGCCDGGSPFLFEDYPPPANHRHIADIEGIPVWVDNGLWADQELHLTIDAVKDPASDSFSAESELGYRLVIT